MMKPETNIFKIIFIAVLWVAGTIFCAAQTQDTLKIVAFGNSTTAPRKNISRVYPSILQDTLKFMNINAIVINSGIPGSHSGSIKDNDFHKVLHAMDRFESAVLSYHPKWVIISFGINDSWQDNGRQNPSRISIEDYHENLLYFIDQVEKNNGKPILMTPNPIGIKYEKWRYERLKNYMEIIKGLAKKKKTPLVDVWSLFYNHVKNKPVGIDFLLLDGMHPNDIGHKIMADAVIKIIIDSKNSKNVTP